MWVLLDNRDSFTHILHHSLLLAGAEDLRVVKSHDVSLEELIAMNPERLIISPGPETPAQAGITMAALDYFLPKIPVLGICLGHQAIGLYFGARLVKARQPMHGFTSRMVREETHPLFEGLPNPFEAMRYHSLVLEGLEGTGLDFLAHAEDDGSIQVVGTRKVALRGHSVSPGIYRDAGRGAVVTELGEDVETR